MSVSVKVRDGETVEQAILRFRRLLRHFGPPGTNCKRADWHKKKLDYYLKPSELTRRDALRDAFATYSGECARRKLTCVIRRRTKRRKVHFGNAPIVCKYP